MVQLSEVPDLSLQFRHCPSQFLFLLTDAAHKLRQLSVVGQDVIIEGWDRGQGWELLILGMERQRTNQGQDHIE